MTKAGACCPQLQVHMKAVLGLSGVFALGGSNPWLTFSITFQKIWGYSVRGGGLRGSKALVLGAGQVSQ